MSSTKEILARIPQRPAKIVSVTCAATSPFEVYIDGDAVPVGARLIDGATAFGLGDTGYAFWQSPLPPICFKTI